MPLTCEASLAANDSFGAVKINIYFLVFVVSMRAANLGPKPQALFRTERGIHWVGLIAFCIFNLLFYCDNVK